MTADVMTKAVGKNILQRNIKTLFGKDFEEKFNSE
jgi:hypothetical protein